jgi:hypothetical protein
MTATLRVPQNWPSIWGAWDNSVVKIACPSPGCGTFTLVMHRHDDGSIKSLSCVACGLSGLPATQAAFDALPGALAEARRADAQAHETAMAETQTHLQMTKAKIQQRKNAA